MTKEESRNTQEFMHFKLHSDSTLKSMTKEELISYIHVLYHNWQAADEQLHNVIEQNVKLADNPPLSFDGLVNMIGLPVWDDKEKMWLIVGETYKPFAFNVPICEDALSIKLVNNEYCNLIITNNFEYHEKFEENRFYKREKEAV